MKSDHAGRAIESNANEITEETANVGMLILSFFERLNLQSEKPSTEGDTMGKVLTMKKIKLSQRK